MKRGMGLEYFNCCSSTCQYDMICISLKNLTLCQSRFVIQEGYEAMWISSFSRGRFYVKIGGLYMERRSNWFV